MTHTISLPLNMLGEIYKQAPTELRALRAASKDVRDEIDSIGQIAVEKLSQEERANCLAYLRIFSKKNPEEVQRLFLQGTLYPEMLKWQSKAQNNLCTFARNNRGIIPVGDDAESIRAWLRSHQEELQEIETLELDCAGIDELPIELAAYFPNVTKLTLKYLAQPDERIGLWTNLQELDLTLSHLRTLPASIGTLSSLTSLSVDWSSIRSLPKAIQFSNNKYIYNLPEVVRYRIFPARVLIGIGIAIMFLAFAASLIAIFVAIFPPLLFILPALAIILIPNITLGVGAILVLAGILVYVRRT